MLAVDISALCDMCEYLTGSFVLGRSLLGFHNITLPKSWIVTLANRFKNGRFRPLTHKLSDFVDGLAALLNDLYNGFESACLFPCMMFLISLQGAGYLRFEGGKISDSFTIRGAFIARM